VRQATACRDPLLPIGLPALPVAVAVAVAVAAARPIILRAAERGRLKTMAYGHKTEYRLRMRAQVVLHAARGRSNARIARETGVPLARWSCPELAAELAARGITGPVSASTVRRWLAEDALKPWQHQSWIFITDPDFRAKAQRVLDLYSRTWQGTPLGEHEYVISADEKTSIQARCRCHPTLAPGQARAMRVNHTYGRGGAPAYLAASMSTARRCSAAPSRAMASTRSWPWSPRS